MTSSFPFGEVTGSHLHWNCISSTLDGVNFDAVSIQAVVPECGLGYKTVFWVEMPSNESCCGKGDNREAVTIFDQCSVQTLDMWQWPSEEELFLSHLFIV